MPPLIDIAHVWRASELAHLGGASVQTISTGYAALSRVLPGGGWPCGAMTEVLQAQPGQHEWGLVAPALGQLQAATPASWVVLVGAPYCPFGPALGARQLHMQRMLAVNSVNNTAQNTAQNGAQNSAKTPAKNGIKNDNPAMLWATREALQCADVVAVLAWLPDARSAHLRRLQIAALTHNKLLFVFRPLAAQHDSSPAPLRLRLAGMPPAESMAEYNLQIDVFKRRGPTLAAPVLIDTRPPRLAALLAASRERVHQHEQPREQPSEHAPEHEHEHAHAHDRQSALFAKSFDLSEILRKPLHALDRTASLEH